MTGHRWPFPSFSHRHLKTGASHLFTAVQPTPLPPPVIDPKPLPRCRPRHATPTPVRAFVSAPPAAAQNSTDARSSSSQPRTVLGAGRVRPGACMVRGTAAGCGLLSRPLGVRLSTLEPRSSVPSSQAGPTCPLGWGLLSARGSCGPTLPRAVGPCPVGLTSSVWHFCTLADLTAPCVKLSVGSRGSSGGVNADGRVRGPGAPRPALEKTR